MAVTILFQLIVIEVMILWLKNMLIILLTLWFYFYDYPHNAEL